MLYTFAIRRSGRHWRRSRIVGMVRALILGVITLAIGSAAVADELVLQDGRILVGTVTVKGETVAIDMPYGSLLFSREQVVRIEFKLTPEQEFDKRLAKVSPDDADALFGLASGPVRTA